MQEVILAVSHAGWFSGQLVRAIGIPLFLIVWSTFLAVQLFRAHLDSKRREKEWLEYQEHREKIEKRNLEMERRKHYIKRRKDHPLTTIFKNEMPKGTRPSYLGISKGNF